MSWVPDVKKPGGGYALPGLHLALVGPASEAPPGVFFSA
ncbi:hypothetical protein CSC02_0495 [Enterobacter hormaechei subsp. hoffmannii]|nr:hypothetical protein CSC02_0495 [Enterobacter hormaechei subsp. hoffmannii]